MPRRVKTPANLPATPAAQAAPALVPAPRPYRVLLVDDEPQVFRLLEEGLRSQHMTVLQAHTLAQARRELAKGPLDLVLIEPSLKDGSGLSLAEELSRLKPAVQTIVISGKPSLEHAVEAIRAGAADFLVKPLNLAELNQRVRQAILRRKLQQRSVTRVKRLRRICQKLDKAREEVTQQVDILCNDLVTAYQELAAQMQAMVQTSEFSAIIRDELDLESLVRKVLEYLLEKAGPTNAALFLPTGTAEFALGGYINYDCSSGSSDLVLQHLADVLAPKVAASEAAVQITDNEALAAWLADDAAYLADCHVLATACRHNGETLAVLVLFRDHSQPFGDGLYENCLAIAPILGDYLARIIRVHHRHLPDAEQ